MTIMLHSGTFQVSNRWEPASYFYVNLSRIFNKLKCYIQRKNELCYYCITSKWGFKLLKSENKTVMKASVVLRIRRFPAEQ